MAEKKVLTPEEKAERAQRLKEGREKAAAERAAKAVANPEEPKAAAELAPVASYTQEQVQQMIAEAVQQAVAAMPAVRAEPSVIQVSTNAPVVKIRYQSECSPVNLITFGQNGKFGSITGQTGTFSVPKESFAGEFRDELVQNLIASRELIILDGLTDEERELYGCKYRDGEYMDEKTFAKMADMGNDILDIYPELCLPYKEMVAKRFFAEYEKHPAKIDRALITKLNELSKQDYRDLPKEDARRKGAFYQIIEAMNRKDAATD